MPLTGPYLPSPRDFAREQAELYERTGGREGNTRDGYTVIVMTSRGAKTGAVRKTPLIRVERDGAYAAVASIGGAPKNPAWYHNLIASPLVEVQDGPITRDYIARRLSGTELEEWWALAVEVFPPYAHYREICPREIPVFVLTPAPAQP